MIISWGRMVRPLRLLVALASAIIFSRILGIPMSGWVMITTTVVLFDQATVGGTINRSLLRFMATFLGGLISLVCIILFKDKPFLIWTTLASATFIYAYIFMDSKKSYIGVLGIGTMAMLLIGNSEPQLHIVFLRILDIMLGIFFALIAMLVIFPQYALNKSRALIYTSIRDMEELFRTSLGQTSIELIRQEILKVETKFINDVVNFNKTLEEAKYELKGNRSPQLLENYAKSFLQIRRLYRLIIIIFYYELDNGIIENPLVQQILKQLQSLLAELRQEHPDFEQLLQGYPQVKALTLQVSSVTLSKTCLNFINELQTLNSLLAENTDL